jgi:hypothetical protein
MDVMRELERAAALGNDELLRSLSSIVKRDNALTAELLAHLAECDERRLHLELGYSSMFAYATEALGFCEATAWRRVAAARVCRRFPEALALVETGDHAPLGLVRTRPSSERGECSGAARFVPSQERAAHRRAPGRAIPEA